MIKRKGFYIIEGNPIAQQRHRHTKRGFTYDPLSNEKKVTRLQIKSQQKKKLLTEGSVYMFITFYMKRPKSHYRTGKFSHMLKSDEEINHTKKPDIDNLCKYLFDCCSKVLFKDDSQICSLTALKMYSDNPRTEFTIQRI